jgi:hypothetical protein
MSLTHAFVATSLVLVALVASCASDPRATLGGGTDAGGTPGPQVDATLFSDGPLTPEVVVHRPSTGCDETSCVGAGGQCQGVVCVISENPGNVPQNVVDQLRAGGSADASFGFLYPYDRTIFPRGLLPPTLQFAGGGHDATLVRVTSGGMKYEGLFGPSPARITFSEPLWTALTLAAPARDDVTVEVTKISGGKVTGPIAESWQIAQGSLRGTIYYETYDSQIAGGMGSVGIMRLDPGAHKPTVIKSGCGNVCHTASADGSTLVANTALGFGSASYDLKNNAATIYNAPNLSMTYGGLYPDGSILMSATNYRTWAAPFGAASSLYDTKTGAKLSAPGWDGVITNAGTPAFSPDGKHIAFNHEDVGGGHTLAAMDYDPMTRTFTNLADIANAPGRTLAWPAFTPDGKWVVFHSGTNAEFETDGGANGDLFIVDLATHATQRLDSLNGYLAGGAGSYLPEKDVDLSFAPTVLPEAVGGYFWVVFTSHRSYGNLLQSKDHDDTYGKLWVAAIDLDPTPHQDPSHPAFLLDGQEMNADNLRGFWVLSPCRSEGSDCRSGDECCDGYCRPADAGGEKCVVAPPGCANEYERCGSASDCCDPVMECINGHCAKPPPR